MHARSIITILIMKEIKTARTGKKTYHEKGGNDKGGNEKAKV